ncbi:MAG: response regulator [Chromatiales bacterium]|jgi:putative two-component system response regulator|nr:response regulator [Chromatiales bacterium]MDX9766122.1 response regulator [Ectothiorhodospiraceae bacterium]
MSAYLSPATQYPSTNRAPFRVLVVDDVATNRVMLRAILAAHGYEVVEADCGEAALARLVELEFDAVILDVLMPGKSGFDVCREIRLELGFEFLPVIMLTSLGSPDDMAMGFESGATDFVTKPYNNVELVARVNSAVAQKRLTDRLDDTESVLFALARMVESKDRNTRDHCDRLSHMAVVFGRSLGLSFDELEALRRGGILHDIGKLGIPDGILLKEGPLTESEWLIMRQHPVIGAELCTPLRTMRKTVDIIRHHHEKWNGAGYPDGLSGTDVPLLARVFQVVDVFDALTTERPYKPAFPVDQTIDILERETADGNWDPDLMQRFLHILNDQPEQLQRPLGAPMDPSARILARVLQSGRPDWERG